jgi:hypothetical protein
MVEHLSDRQRRRRVLTDQAEALGIVGWCRILEPEQAMRLEIFAEPCGFNRTKPMVHVVQQVHVEAKLAPQPLEQRRHAAQIALAAPDSFENRSTLRRLVGSARRHAVYLLHAGNAALRADSLVAALDETCRGFHGVIDRLAVRVAIDEHLFARCAAEQLIDRCVQRLAFDVPERGVHGGNCGHRDRTAPPIRALVEKLPDVFDPARVAALE